VPGIEIQKKQLSKKIQISKKLLFVTHSSSSVLRSRAGAPEREVMALIHGVRHSEIDVYCVESSTNGLQPAVLQTVCFFETQFVNE